MSAASKYTALAAASSALLLALVLSAAAAAERSRDRIPPSAPTNLRATSATPSSVTLAWRRSTDNVAVAGYRLYVGEKRIRVSETSYRAYGLNCGESIGVWIVALDTSGNRSLATTATVSTAACPDLQAPSAPTGFRQQATTQSAAVLAWTPSTDNAGVVGYDVYRNVALVTTTAQPSATLGGLSCGSAYQYQVDAYDAAGNHSPRSSAWVQSAACGDSQAPTTPTGLAVTARTASSLSLSWSASSDDVAVTGYRVLVNGAPMTVTTTSATVSLLACGTTYTVDVDAFDAAGNHSQPAASSATTTDCPSPVPPPPTPPPPAPQPPAPQQPPDTTPPTQPTALKLAASDETSVAFTWVPSTDEVGVAGYDVYVDGTSTGSVTQPGAMVSGLSCGTTHTLAVDAYDAAGNHSPRAQLTASTAACASPGPAADTSPPTTPGSLALASATKTSVSLTWSASSDNVAVTGYGVYRNGTNVSTVTQPGATFSGLTCGTSYTFAVEAYDAAGNRSPRAQVTASTAACADSQPPSAPANVAASSRTATSIALTWSASSDNVGVTGYGLYKAGAQVSTVTGTTGIFSGLACNTNYTLAVDAYDAAGNHSQKTTVMVSTTACPDTTPPSTPTGLAAANIGQASLDLSWNASSDNVAVTGYEVYRGETKMATVTSTSSSQTGLACGTSFGFAVVAFDAAGNRSQQAQLNASTSACSPAPPPPAPPTGGSITITSGGTYSGHWSASGSATAVAIRTSAPVTIENSVIDQPGSGYLVDANYPGVQLTVTHTTFNGGKGQAIFGNGFKSMSIENNTFNATWGVRLDNAAPSASIVFTRNKAVNIAADSSNPSHFFQTANVDTATIDVSWNQDLETYGASGVTDSINIYSSAFAKVHDNYIQGNYEGSSCGIIVDGAGGHDNDVWNNQVVHGTNCGIAIAGGHDNKIHDNRAISDGRLDNGTLSPAANIGLYVANFSNDSHMTNDQAYNNVSGWINASGQRNDWWLPSCSASCQNTSFSGTVTTSTEQAEYQAWLSKLSANGISVGA